MGRIALYSHPGCALHDTGWGHPEHSGRLRAVMRAVEAALPELAPRVEPVEGRPADVAALRSVHAADHLARVRAAAERARAGGRAVRLDPDTVASSATWEAVLAAAGCVLDALEAVLGGRFRSAFCAIRPPGHHATRDRAMGFCFVNHVAVAARRALDSGRVRRPLIVDWDVHHGNGTQEIFWEDASVFYLSLHQEGLYPGTGRADERGAGAGEGTTRNLPMAPGRPAGEYVRALLGAVEQVAAGFRPDLVLVSAGFDAAKGDPLGGFTLEPVHYRELTTEVARLTRPTAQGRIVSVLEGGYNPDELGRNAVAHLRGLVAAADEGEGGGE